MKIQVQNLTNFATNDNNGVSIQGLQKVSPPPSAVSEKKEFLGAMF